MSHVKKNHTGNISLSEEATLQKETDLKLLKKSLVSSDKLTSNDTSDISRPISVQSTKIPSSQFSSSSVTKYGQIYDNIFDQIKLYTAGLYSNSKISQCVVGDIMSKVSELIKSVLNETKHINSSCSCSIYIHTISEITNQCFYNLKTKYQMEKHFENTKFIIPPETAQISMVTGRKRHHDGSSIGAVNVNIKIIPISTLLQTVLSTPKTYETVISYIDECKQNPVLVSPIQGKIWKKIKSSNANETMVPLGLYTDEFKINNCIGSHKEKTKLGAVYLALLSIPSKYRSVVDNIFLPLIHKSVDYTELGNVKIFGKIIEQLKFLEETGIAIDIDGQKKQIFFSFLYVLGDNLGLNTLLGFTESFSNRRWCITDRNERMTGSVVEKKNFKM